MQSISAENRFSLVSLCCICWCCLLLAGCGGGDSGGGANQANNDANAAAPGAAPAGAPPGMNPAAPGMAAPGMGPAAPGMGPGAAMGASAQAAPTTAAASTRNINAYLPDKVELALGGKPGAVATSQHPAAAGLAMQFLPLKKYLPLLGLPEGAPQNFWFAATNDFSEWALCLEAAADLPVEALRTQLAGPKAAPDLKVIPLPNVAGGALVVAVVDSRTLILGKKDTVDSALRKSSSAVLKQSLGTIDSNGSEFWIAGNSNQANAALIAGLPMLSGTPPTTDNKLLAFAYSVKLDRGETTAGANSGYPGATPGGYPAAGPMGPMGFTAPMATTPMPMATAIVTDPMAAANPMATATPMPMGPMGPMGPGYATPMGTTPMGYPTPGAATGTGVTAPPKPTMVIVQAAFVFDNETTTTAFKAKLDPYLRHAAVRSGPRPPRHIPGSGGGQGQPGAGGYPGGYPMGGNYPTPMPMTPGAYPMPGAMPGESAGAPGGPMGNNSPEVTIPVILEPQRPDPQRPVPLLAADFFPLPAPPVAQPAPGQATAGTTPGMPPGVGVTAEAYVPPPMVDATGMPPGTGTGYPMGYNGAPMGAYPTSGYPGGGYPGTGGGGIPNSFTKQSVATLQLAYKFDGTGVNFPVAVHLVRVLSRTVDERALTRQSLQRLHQATETWRGADPDGYKGLLGNSRQPEAGYSWLVPLLPHLGYAGLHMQLDPKKPWSDPQNRVIAESVIPELLVSTDPRQTWQGGKYHRLGLTHFVGVSGMEVLGQPAAATLPRTHARAGVFGYQGIAKPDQITDGAAQTIMLISSGPLAAPWAVGGAGTIRGIRDKNFEKLTGFGVRDGAGPEAMAIMADGSVREISSSIDPKVLRAMSTIAGQEQVDMQQAGSAPQTQASR